MSQGRIQPSEQENGQGFSAADFITPTARLTDAQKRIEQLKLAEYNRDPADGRARINIEKLGILSKLIRFFSSDDN